MKPRVLFIVESFGCGSVETWLLRMAAHAQLKGIPIDWTFFCTLSTPGIHDYLAHSLGLQVFHSPNPIGHKLAFARALRRIIASGKYNVLHSQHDLVSGFYLAACLGLPLKRRIVHVHNADEEVLTNNPLKKAFLKPALRRACLALSDVIAANSSHALDTFLAGRPRRPGRDLVHPLGIDASRFADAVSDRTSLRLTLALPDNAPILLFAGRMTPEKNPLFAVEVLAELRRLRPDVCGLFVGAGSLEEPVRRRISQLGLEKATRLLGWRNDVPEIMGACDWFILPHPEDPVEAFGIAVVEAQLAGLRLLISRGVLDDPLLPSAVFRRLPLAESAATWAHAAIDLLSEPTPSRAIAQAELEASPMAMDHALDHLLALHA